MPISVPTWSGGRVVERVGLWSWLLWQMGSLPGLDATYDQGRVCLFRVSP